jgi:hypothetical protein
MRGIITAERVRQLLHYDPITGVLTRLISANGNARAGDAAGSVNGDGYIVTKIDGRAGSVCLSSFSGLISGMPAGFRPPRSATAG